MSKVHFITQGCSANVADTEIMEGILQKKGHEVTPTVEDADIVVFNTCTVKSPSESRFIRTLKSLELDYPDKKIVIGGCIPQSSKKNLTDYSLIGTYEVDKISEVIDETLKGNTVRYLKRENKSRINLPKTRKNPRIEIVPISHGCLSACSFCKTKIARGNLFSYPPKEIVRHISRAVRNGAKDIWLSSQDNSAYGLDVGTNMVELLDQIVSIPRRFKVRFGMGNPDYMKDIIDGIIRVFKHEKMYKFIHIPVQAGSDSVLADMKRQYTAQEYKDIVSAIRKEIPDMTFATDIICGFPTETDDDFKETYKLIKETKPDVINISRYWPRPGTPAARMEQVDGREIKKRTKMMTELYHEVAEEQNKRWIGWKGKIMITEEGKNGSMLGRNYAYKQVVIQESVRIGEEVEVEIVQVSPFDLRGTITEKDIEEKLEKPIFEIIS